MKRLGFLSILFIVIFACQKDYNKTKLPYKFIPSNSYTIIKINELNDFINSTENNDILSGIYNKELKHASIILKNFNSTNPIYISFTDSDYVILTKSDSTLFVIDSLANHLSATLVNLHIEKTQIDSTVFYHKIIGNTFAGSNNLELLKTLDSKNENKSLSKLIETTDKKSVASIVFKSDTENYSKLLFSQSEGSKDSNFTVLDFAQTDKNLHYNGILTSKDSSFSVLSSFKNTIPQKTNTPLVAPSETSSLKSITFNDFSIFNKNLNQLNNTTNETTESFLNFTNEIAVIDNAIILHSLDPNLILESIEEKSNLETFREIDIYEFGNPDYFTSNLKPLISFNNANYFSIFKNFVIFSNSTENLKSILTTALNDYTLAKSDAFININHKLSDEASLFIFKNSDGLSDILGKTLKGYNANAVQYIREDNYTHINGIIEKYTKRAASNSVVEAFSTKLDAALISPPQTVKNHVTKAHDIIVQDVNNTLYLISNSGNILWKKSLQGKILGEVKQIDMYKNGRLQLAFATENRVYVLDRNGKDVSPFPLKFNDAITQPLSVFDYDKNRNYRLLVTQGKNLIMYDAVGKSVKGFKYESNTEAIKTQPKHFRIGTKDYIVFGAGETLKILNRQGGVRVNVKDKIRFSGNGLYLYKNKFTTSNTLGQLVQVDTRGRVNLTNLNLTDKHSLVTTSKTLVSLNENKLQIKSKIIELDYGEYTSPRIFYLNDKIYVTTTDLQTKKVYLFDSQAKRISNFPVFGTSAAEMQKLDNEKGLELITQSDDKNLVIYKLY